MKYLIILDNGEHYSDHEHTPILACDTKEEAESYAALWREWFDKFKALGRSWIDVEVQRDCPEPPFGPRMARMATDPRDKDAKPYWYYASENSIDIMPCEDGGRGE